MRDYLKISSGLVLISIILLISTQPIYGSPGAQKAFQRANRAYIELAHSAHKRRLRVNWLKVIEKYKDVAQRYPRTKFAPRALYTEGKLYIQLYGYSARKSDLLSAIKIFTTIVKKYPKSSLADDALYKSARIYDNIFKDKLKASYYYRKIIDRYPNGDMVQRAREGINAIHIESIPKEGKKAKKLASIRHIRQLSDKEYTRVVIGIDRNVPFDTFLMPPDKRHKRPYRLVIDLHNARSSKKYPYRIKSKDGTISQIRVSQYRPHKVRIVLDLRHKVYYNAVPLENPPRIIVDLSAKKKIAKKASVYRSHVKKVRPGTRVKHPMNIPSIARQLSLKVSRIVIDPGHGGKDPGAIGPHGVKEKTVTLGIAKRLAQRLRKEGFKVYLTRSRDVFVPLEERTAFANRKKADLFISIHANAAEDKRLGGVETYFLNLATDASAIRVAARENATTSKSISDLQLIINDLMLNSKINESSKFATYVQRSMIRSLRKKGFKERDLGVKQAPFYVLLGAQMPSILVETSFITNPRECSLLRRKSYQEAIVDGIARGINSYIINTTYAFKGGN